MPDTAAPDRKILECPVVGIGASAGGVEALRLLFPQVGADTEIAFVVVQHLDPTHTSQLAEIIGRHTRLPVMAVESPVPVQPGRVYVIAPGSLLLLRGGQLVPERPRGSHNSIDEFLLSLAEERGDRAACVILSGTGSDGTIGLRAIKEGGGLVLAQAGAEYDGMMRSAVSTGLVDAVLPADEIAGHLAGYFRRNGHDTGGKSDSSAAQIAAQLGEITAMLRAQTGHDFRDYKSKTIVRRIQRRMNVLEIEDAAAFVETLRHNSREITLLFQDLLIGVTSFFRDPEAFAALASEALAPMFAKRGPEETVRVWVPGCATGEEAYSLAMLLREATPEAQRAPKLQIFASDIDDHALNVGRAGRYPATIAKDLTPELLARYFVREDGTYRVANEIREICLFSSHNLLRDAPFSRIDLISCRNLLIYLSNDLQDRVIPLFHYALAPGGALFLGTSENVSRHARLFGTIDKVNRIFRRRTLPERRVPDFPLTRPDPAQRGQAPALRRAAATEPNLRAAVERHLLDRFTPAHVVVNAEGEVLQASGRTGKYLQLPAGVPDTNVINLARPGLRLELRAALQRAVSQQQGVAQRGVPILSDGGAVEIDLFVQPLRLHASAEPLYLVVFQDVGPTGPHAEPDRPAPDDVGEPGIRALENELRLTRDRLQTATEELESSNEELTSSNEELQSINEELQSANEELETSKEELQSINEELQTVNSELSARVEELSRANNDMSNLLESTQIATVFLDRVLNVKSFTPAAKDVFWLVESDAGRPLMHVRARVAGDTLGDDAARVLRTLAPIERAVERLDGTGRYMMRMLPYRTADNLISGVVMTFTDVTRISAAEARIEELTNSLRSRIHELEAILDIVPAGVMIAADPASGILVNTHAARLFGDAAPHRGLKPAAWRYDMIDEAGEILAADQQPLARAAASGQPVIGWQGRVAPENGPAVPVMISANPLFGDNRQVRGAVAAIVDITHHKQAEAQQQFLLSELQHRVKNILATVASLASRLSRGRTDPATFREAFLSRIGALARTHDVLSRAVWAGASLRTLVNDAMEPHAGTDGDNIRIEGPDISLAPKAVTTLGMVLHELATNATKYGALSKAGGTVSVEWNLAGTPEAGQLTLHWRETGGPAVGASRPPGFGLGFIARSVEYELSGNVLTELAPAGLVCTIAMPLAGNLESP